MHVQLVQYVQHVGPFGSFFLHFFTSTKGKQNIDAAMHNWPMFTTQEYIWLFYLSVWKGRNPSLQPVHRFGNQDVRQKQNRMKLKTMTCTFYYKRRHRPFVSFKWIFISFCYYTIGKIGPLAIPLPAPCSFSITNNWNWKICKSLKCSYYIFFLVCWGIH